MDYTIKTSSAVKLSSECLVVGAFKDTRPSLTPSGVDLDAASGERLGAILRHGDLCADAGETLLLYDLPGLACKRVLVVGLGNAANFDLGALRKAAVGVAKCLQRYRIGWADMCLLEVDIAGVSVAQRARALVIAMQTALYSVDTTNTRRTTAASLEQVSLLTAPDAQLDAQAGVSQGWAIAAGMEWARDLGNLPGNICTPSYLASAAMALQEEQGLTVTVLGEAEMQQLKMGALLSVARGSREEARLLVIQYDGGDSAQRPVVLIGKGLTFDAGGISLKPAASMDEMKFDMCGGASVLGVMRAVAELGLPQNVLGIVPASENLPDGAANKPGDVVTAMAGTSIEILNTDAEGRLLLCDALTYAKRYNPDVVIDIATLTGACMIALGAHASGLFCDDEPLAQALLDAGQAAGDRAWRLPLWDDYSRQLRSNFADLANIGGRAAGAVTAACFLKHFATDLTWAHLDIAGTAWLSGEAKGATGRPVPLLMEFLLSRTGGNSG